MEKNGEEFKYALIDGPLVDTSQSRCALSGKLSSRVGFPPPPRDRLGRGRPSPIDGRPPAAGFGEVRPDQEQEARSIGEEKMIDRATAELTDELVEAQS
jgi:hypothetical protein